MKNKSKKNKTPVFKAVPKTDNEESQIKELQIKKKILEEKYISNMQSADKAQKEMMEVKARLLDIKNTKENEITKFSSIKSDFDNNLLLVKKNYKTKIDDLKLITDDKDKIIAQSTARLEEMKNDYNGKMDQRNKTSALIRQNMEDLSKFFSTQLSEIQNNLEMQIDKISGKWETNLTSHLKYFDEYAKKYDLAKDN